MKPKNIDTSGSRTGTNRTTNPTKGEVMREIIVAEEDIVGHI